MLYIMESQLRVSSFEARVDRSLVYVWAGADHTRQPRTPTSARRVANDVVRHVVAALSPRRREASQPREAVPELSRVLANFHRETRTEATRTATEHSHGMLCNRHPGLSAKPTLGFLCLGISYQRATLHPSRPFPLFHRRRVFHSFARVVSSRNSRVIRNFRISFGVFLSRSLVASRRNRGMHNLVDFLKNRRAFRRAFWTD